MTGAGSKGRKPGKKKAARTQKKKRAGPMKLSAPIDFDTAMRGLLATGKAQQHKK